MARVIIGDSNRLIPAPFVNVVKNFTKTPDGKIIGTTFTINIIGTIVAFKGSPYHDGSKFTFWKEADYPPDNTVNANSRLEYIFRKQDKIRELFRSSQEGIIVELQPDNGKDPLKFYARLVNIDFPDDLFYDTCKYTITLEADVLLPQDEGSDNFAEYLQDARESWVLETDESLPQGLDPGDATDGTAVPRTYRVTHTIGATGKRTYNNAGSLIAGPYGGEAWQWAKAYVDDKLGLDTTVIDDLDKSETGDPEIVDGITSATHTAYNHIRTVNRDETAGSYEITETWLLATDSAIEDFTIEKNASIDQTYDRYTISGTVTGLEVRNTTTLELTTDKYSNASTKFDGTVYALLKNRVAAYFSEISVGDLHPIPLSEVVGRNPVTGVITYTYEYDTRPVVIPGTKSVTLTITDTLDGESFASIFILGRTAGPLLQALNTKPSLTRTLDIELVLESPPGWTLPPPASYFDNNPRTASFTHTDPDYDNSDLLSIISAVKPATDIVQIFESPIQEVWEPLEGRYSFNQQWTFEK